MGRRSFLRVSGAMLCTAGLAGLAHRALAPRRLDGATGLVADPAGLLDLPPGFAYVRVSKTGDLMADGLAVPGRPDGMGAFAGPDGLTYVVRNHELHFRDPRGLETTGEPGPPRQRFDPGPTPGWWRRRVPLGGTTTFVYDTAQRSLVHQVLSLGGTLRNCGGGATPWGTWISCEEYATDAWSERERGVTRRHGYCFEVDPFARSRVPPQPLEALGRFLHEGVAVDPETSVVYLTEDREDSVLYRFLPRAPRRLAAGGWLQALCIQGLEAAVTDNRTGSRFALQAPYDVHWVDLPDPDREADDLRVRARRNGAAVFKCGEGIEFQSGAVYFAATSGGRSGRGQVWRLDVRRDALALWAEADAGNDLMQPDSVAAAPGPGLLLAEDAAGPNRLWLMRENGTLVALARNAMNDSELTGPCFSPDGTTLFVNIQRPGITLAVGGPWDAWLGARL